LFGFETDIAIAIEYAVTFLSLVIFDPDPDSNFDKAIGTVLILDPRFFRDDKSEAALNGQP